MTASCSADAPLLTSRSSVPAAGEGGEGSGGAGAAESDLQLAWENLETAKHIWAQQPDKFPLELAGGWGLGLGWCVWAGLSWHSVLHSERQWGCNVRWGYSFNCTAAAIRTTLPLRPVPIPSQTCTCCWATWGARMRISRWVGDCEAVLVAARGRCSRGMCAVELMTENTHVHWAAAVA